MDRTSVHTSPTLPSKWVGVEKRLHISSVQSFKRPLHLSLNLSPSRLQTGFYTGQKSTRVSHHLYGLGPLALTTTSSRIEDRPTTPARADVEEGGGTFYLASTLYFQEVPVVLSSWAVFFFLFFFPFQFSVSNLIARLKSVLSNSAQLPT